MECPAFSAYKRPIWSLVLLWILFVPWVIFAQQYPSQQDLTSMSLEDLARVKVFTASRHLEYSEDAPSAVSVITAEEISRYGWRTLGDVLNTVRGFYTAYDRDYTYLGVRGFLRSGDYNSRILLLVNGHRLNDKVYDSAQIGTEFPLDLDLIDHIEIVRGPSSSLFGTNAVFGVINVITRQPSARAVLEASGDSSSFMGRTGQVTASFQENGLAAILSGSMYRSAGQGRLFFPEFASPSTNGGFAENMDGDRYDHAFADLRLGNFRLQGLFSNRTKVIPTAAYETNFNDPRTHSKDEREYVDLSYHRSVSSKTDLDLRGYYDSYKSLGVGAFGGTDPASSVLGYTRGRADWLGAEATIGRQIGRQRITAGAEYEYCLRVEQKNYYAGLPPFLDNHQTPWQAATYGQAELNLFPKMTINAGGRLDWFDTFGGAFSPRIAAIYALNSRTSLKYIFARAFRAPNAYESYYADIVFIGETNPNLRPENMQSQEAVLERHLRPWLLLTTDGFYNNLRNLINEAPDPATGLTHFVNVGRDRGRGVELELEAKRESGLTARASYTLADARDTIQSVRLANSPLHTAKVNASIPLVRHTFAGVELRYSSSQESYQGTRVPSTFLTNITFSTKPLWGGWQFDASCYNALNRETYAAAGPEMREPEIQQDGRAFRFKVTYRLPVSEGRTKP
jgi:iron complex outermembrane receptor protein